jgi:hypothetical protein
MLERIKLWLGSWTIDHWVPVVLSSLVNTLKIATTSLPSVLMCFCRSRKEFLTEFLRASLNLLSMSPTNLAQVFWIVFLLSMNYSW